MIWDGSDRTRPPAFFATHLNFPGGHHRRRQGRFLWAAAENITLSGALGYNDAALSETATLWPGTDSERTAPDGTRLPLMPKWKYSLTGRFDFDATLWSASPYFLASWTYNGDSLNSLAGIQSSINQAGVRVTPSYNIVDFRFGLDGEGWSASLFVDNLSTSTRSCSSANATPRPAPRCCRRAPSASTSARTSTGNGRRRAWISVIACAMSGR
jgi:outer membrane receptor protein involved in Fe transport